MPREIKQKATGDKNAHLALICVGFGVSLLLEAYVLGVLLGGWLDARFDAKPWFTLLGVMLALFGSFYQLYRLLTGRRPAPKDDPAATRQPPKEN